MRFNRSDIADFAYFLVVAKHLSFRKAGLELGISASAVSHAMKALETRLDVRLLNRTNRSVTLTTAGDTLRGSLQAPFDAIEDAVDVLNQFRSTPSGHIRLNVMVGAAHSVLAPVLPVFIDRYPNVLVELAVTNRMVDVIAQGFDAGIRFGGTVPEDMIAMRLSPDVRWVVAASPAYLERWGVPQTPKDLEDHRCVQIRLGDDTIYRWEFEKGEESVTLSVPGPIIVDDGATAMKFAIGGAGMVYVNEWDIKDYVARGELTTVLDDWSSFGGGYFMYYSSRRQVPSGVKLLVDLIREIRPLG